MATNISQDMRRIVFAGANLKKTQLDEISKTLEEKFGQPSTRRFPPEVIPEGHYLRKEYEKDMINVVVDYWTDTQHAGACGYMAIGTKAHDVVTGFERVVHLDYRHVTIYASLGENNRKNVQEEVVQFLKSLF